MKNTYTLCRVILLCFTLPPLLGCVLKSDEDSNIQSKLNQNRRKWASEMVSNYQFDFRWSCYCGPEYIDPVNISVRKNRIDSAALVEGNVPIPIEVAVTRYRTIEGLFDLLQEGINKNAHSILAEYHSELGYLTDAWIDYDEHTVDEELGFEIDGLLIE